MPIFICFNLFSIKYSFTSSNTHFDLVNGFCVLRPKTWNPLMWLIIKVKKSKQSTQPTISAAYRSKINGKKLNSFIEETTKIGTTHQFFLKFIQVLFSWLESTKKQKIRFNGNSLFEHFPATTNKKKLISVRTLFSSLKRSIHFDIVNEKKNVCGTLKTCDYESLSYFYGIGNGKYVYITVIILIERHSQYFGWHIDFMVSIRHFFLVHAKL